MMNSDLIKNMQAIFNEQRKLADQTWDVESTHPAKNKNLQGIIDALTTSLSVEQKKKN